MQEPPEVPPPAYAGLVTRAIAFAIDAVVVNGTAIVTGVVVGLGLSVLTVPDKTEDLLLAIGAVLYVFWSVLYFVGFWSSTGQTPGNRLMRIRVCHAATGGRLNPGRALVRLAATVLAAIPLLAGFLPILWDPQRRGIHDRLGSSVVMNVP